MYQFKNRSFHEIFPYEAYRSQQKKIIKHITYSLQNHDSCVVVARNGAGKTILVLTSILSIESSGVYILTRTHRQMAHFVEELDVIRENKDVDIEYIELLSRSSYCINPEVRKLEREHIDLGCYRASKHSSNDLSHSYCSYRGISGIKKIDIISPSSFNIKHGDMNSIRKYALDRKVCPYYLARGLSQKFPIVIGTYMYIDKDVRRALDIKLDGKIIIFDECHNIPGFLEEKQKRTIDIPTIRKMKKKRGLTRRLIRFLNRAKEFIENIQEDMGRSNQMKISYSDFGSYMEDCQLSRPFILSVVKSLKSLAQDPRKYNIVFTISQMVSFFELYYQIDNIAFLGYINKIKENRKIVVKVGIQSLDIAPAIHELIEEGAKLVFMSGTLETEMFNFRLKLNEIENDTYEYLFDERRIQLYLIDKGVNNIPLTTSYYARNPETFEEYGKTVQALIPTIPEGLLFFFPSYGYKDQIVESWEDIGLIKYEYTEEGKTPFLNLEDRKIRLFIDDTQSQGEKIEQFKEYVENNDAALLAVYRSRASEGEDYKNIKGIFIIGIPLANIKDAGVTLKMNYYNSLRVGYGQSWYNSNAMDAVNQACGRGIRKEKDYCSIFLMDNRFKKGIYFNHLSRWIKAGLVQNPPIKHHDPENITPVLHRFYLKNAKINQLRGYQ